MRVLTCTHSDDAITVEVGVMHEPKASALRNRDRYCIILVRVLKHLLPAKGDINITYSICADISWFQLLYLLCMNALYTSVFVLIVLALIIEW